MGNTVAGYYDWLIEENNDPVQDSELLKRYMDQWDGEGFIERMELSREKSVLEIGVGTGRLAVRAAPLCGGFYGIDISSKTIGRAEQNLAVYGNVTLLYGDFLSYEFDLKFDVIYSSLTFMHIKDKQSAILKIAGLLKKDGRFVLSIDKNQDKHIDMGKSQIQVYPDTPEKMKHDIKYAKMKITEWYETAFAFIFVCEK